MKGRTMDQQIRFCTTSDGVTIAYSTVGEGPPLVYANGWPGHLSLELEAATSRGLIESIGRGVTLVRYDMRGSGLSDRDGVEVSIENAYTPCELPRPVTNSDRFANAAYRAGYRIKR